MKTGTAKKALHAVKMIAVSLAVLLGPALIEWVCTEIAHNI